jgi:hypothetical protein
VSGSISVLSDLVTTYQTAEGSSAGDNATKVPSSIDFPLLLLNASSNDDLNKLVNAYITVLTNQTETTASHHYTRIVPTTYKWLDDSSTSFTAQTTPSLTWTNGQLCLVSNTYDNTNSQFTLLDVQYCLPTNTQTVVYHLYIPVLVQKVLNFTFEATVLQGTDYNAADYTGRTTTVLASHGDSVTALLTFRYERSQQDWQNALYSGDDLLWTYNKTVYFNNSDQYSLPVGTRMILVDKNSGGLAYSYTITESDVPLQKLDFTVFESITDGSKWNSATSGTDANPALCDALSLSAAEDTSGAFIRVSSSDSPTVRVLDSNDGVYYYYRLATEAERAAATSQTGEASKLYSITVGNASNSTASNYAAEQYYLTIQTPSASADTQPVNTVITFDATTTRSLSGGKLPNACKSSLSTAASRFILGNFLNQTLSSFSTTGSDGLMSASNTSITASMTTSIKFQDDYSAGLFREYGGSTALYQQFVLEMNQFDADNYATSVTPSLSYTGTVQFTLPSTSAASSVPDGWTVKQDGSNTVYTSTVQVSAGTSRITLTCPVDLRPLLVAQTSTNQLDVTATVTFDFSDNALRLELFPLRDSVDDPKTGTLLRARSELAFSADLLKSNATRTALKDDASGVRYYRQDSTLATLSYNADLSQLGINPSDASQTVPALIKSNGRYDASALKAQSNAKTVLYTLTLAQKNANGSYVELSDPQNYLSEVRIQNSEAQLSDNTYTVTQNWSDVNVDGTALIYATFNVLTGDDFESSSLLYSNYSVILTVCLLDEENKVLEGSTAINSFIYTNARIYTGIVS